MNTAKPDYSFIKDWEKDALLYIERSLRWKHHDALTLYHDACLTCIEQLRTGKIVDLRKPYLFKVCKNLGANNYRTKEREKSRYHNYFEQEKVRMLNDLKQRYDMDNVTIDNKKANKAMIAFYQLGERCQELIRLKHQQGLSFKEITNDTNLYSSIESARVTMYRCMKNWRKLLELSK